MRKSKIKEPSKSSRINKLPSILLAVILPLLIAFLGLCFQYYIARPNIIVDSIEAHGDDPFAHEFIIKNVGMTKAYRLKTLLKRPEFITENRITVKSHPEHPSIIDDNSKISGVDMVPQQTYSFSINSYIETTKSGNDVDAILKNKSLGKVVNAIVTFSFNYTDFLGIKYQNEITYHTVKYDNSIKWTVVGPYKSRL
jgi:hypothetical protein